MLAPGSAEKLLQSGKHKVYNAIGGTDLVANTIGARGASVKKKEKKPPRKNAFFHHAGLRADKKTAVHGVSPYTADLRYHDQHPLRERCFLARTIITSGIS